MPPASTRGRCHAEGRGGGGTGEPGRARRPARRGGEDVAQEPRRGWRRTISLRNAADFWYPSCDPPGSDHQTRSRSPQRGPASLFRGPWITPRPVPWSRDRMCCARAPKARFLPTRRYPPCRTRTAGHSDGMRVRHLRMPSERASALSSACPKSLRCTLPLPAGEEACREALEIAGPYFQPILSDESNCLRNPDIGRPLNAGKCQCSNYRPLSASIDRAAFSRATVPCSMLDTDRDYPSHQP